MAKFQNPAVVINAASGSTTNISEEIFEFFADRHAVNATCHYVDPQDLDSTLDMVLDEGADLLVTFGGDGTSLAAAHRAGTKNIPIVPLPGGTMNILPKALYGSEDWPEVLDLALSQDTPRWIPAGRLNEQTFLVAAMIGTVVRVGVTRELMREGAILQATTNMVETLRDVGPDEGFLYRLDGAVTPLAANMLQVTCPFMSAYSDDPEAFEIAAVNIMSYADLPALGLTALMDEWRDNKSVESQMARKVEVIGEGDIEVLLDGEYRTLQFPLSISLNRKGAYILCPAPKQQFSQDTD
ncbi:diacylglycerol/lipid kinase family protein [Litorimonas sp. RW-G-Af-16]|uniref:diacylglycerol/lipid kinase family protein n=1 Tax=Litorimonas sp. RW-G-Af-16 TaxID=3241168 RepID=UPI00390CC78D